MSNSDSASIARILVASWQQQRNTRSLLYLSTMLATCVLVPPCFYLWSESQIVSLPASTYPEGDRLVMAAQHHLSLSFSMWAIASCMLIGWQQLVGNVLKQNRAAYARLVPGHVARLRASLLVAWAALILAAAGGPGWVLDAPLAWACGGAAALTLFAMAVRWPVLWLAGIAAMVATAVRVARHSASHLLDALFVGWRQDAWFVTTVVLTACALALVAIVRESGHDSRTLVESGRAFGRRFARTARPGCGSESNRIARPYAWWMTRLLARADSSIQARLLAGLGPNVHWTTAVTSLAVTALAIPAMVAVLMLVGLVSPVVHGALPMVAGSIALGAMFGLAAPATQTRARLHQTQREQALLALLPGVPRGPVLSRWLSLRMAAQCMLTWSGAAAITAMLVLLALHLPGDPLDRDLADLYIDMPRSLALGSLSIVAFQWPRWAEMPTPTSLNALWPTLSSVAVAGLVFCAEHMGWMTATQAAAIVPLAVFAWCAWRWHRLGREPSAFPVGRLAR